MVLGVAPIVGIAAGVAVVLLPLVSWIIKRRSRERLAEAGAGDEPGSPDRGPEGIKM